MADSIQNITIRYKLEGNFDQVEKNMSDLTKEEQELVRAFLQVNKEADKAGDQIKKNAKESQDATGKTTKSVETLSNKFSSLKNVITSGFSVDSIKQLGSELINVSGSTGKASVAMQVFKVALASTGVGLLVVALGALYAYFQKTEEGGDRAARSMQSIKVVSDILLNALAKLGKYIADYIVVWIEIFTTVYGFLAKLIGESLVGFAALAEALGMDGVAGALKTAGTVMIEAEGNFRAMKKEAEETGAAIANLADEIENLTQVVAVQNEELQTVIEKNLKALRNRNITYKEAMGLIDEISEAERQMLENNIGLNEKELMSWYKRNALVIENSDAFYNLWNQYRSGTISATEYTKSLQKLSDELENGGQFGKDQIDEFVKLYQAQQGFVRQSEVLGERINNIRSTVREKATAEREKAYQDQLKALASEEKILIRQAQINGENGVYINQLKQRELERRIQLMQRYGKQETDEYKNLLLDRRQLQLEFDKLTDDEIDQRGVLRRQAEQEELDRQRAFLGQQTANALEAINKQAEADKKADEEKIERKKQVESAIQNLIKETANTIFTIQKNVLDAQLQQIQTQKAAEIAAAGDSKQAIAVINERYAKQEAAIKRKQAQTDRTQALFNIALSTAQAVIKSFASVPPPAGIPLALLVAGIGAAQAAAVLSKPIPAFNKGTRSVPGVDTGKDSILAMLRPGEAVVPVDKNQRSSKLIDGIISGKIDDRILSMNYAGIEKSLQHITINSDMSGLEVKLDKLNKTMENLKVTEISFDKRGYHAYMVSANGRTEFMNNYYKN